ncbi:MAG: hypothetical protein QXO54_03020 [Candidatus Methanomethylicaceae archaeon]|nr:(Fe-S)-binding protein [Candidatus Verstraetearchaeota archaeon]
MKTLYDYYRLFPHTDCGYCGSTSCLTMLRRYCLGKSDLNSCIYFKSGELPSPKISYSPPHLKEPPTEKISYIRPCPSEPTKVTIEVNVLPQTHSPYGYFDMITADSIFDRQIPNLKISPSLGIVRIESEAGDVMVFSEGKVIIRRGADEKRAFWEISRAVRLLWATVNRKIRAESAH